jgi:DNA-binding transcriptional MerR regulator
MTDPKGGKYRIQTVAEMTGVPASTLRTWEQRYGFPSPDRTASAYRVYSDEDIREIVRVRELCDRGLAPAEAVQEVVAGSKSGAKQPARPSAAPEPALAMPALAELAGAIVEAVEAFDPERLEQLVRTALLAGSHREVMAQAIEPAWREVRRRWLEGDLGRHHERLAAERLAHVARDMVRVAAPGGAHGWAVIGCFEDDDDAITALAGALAVQGAGLRVAFLGPRTPTLAIRDAARDLDAALVGLAVGDTPSARRARDLLDEYATAIAGRQWFVTGSAAGDLRDAIERGAGRVLETSAEIEAFARSVTP